MPVSPPLIPALMAAAVLAGCAASYVPSTDPSAVQVRVRNLSKGASSSVMGYMRTVSAAGCGTRVAVPPLWPWAGFPAATAVGPQGAAPAPLFPRLPMIGSTDPQRTDQAELLLPPGRQQFEFHASVPGYCRMDVAVEFEPGRPYEIGFEIYRVDSANARCRVTALRHNGSGWLPVALVAVPRCS